MWGACQVRPSKDGDAFLQTRENCHVQYFGHAFRGHSELVETGAIGVMFCRLSKSCLDLVRGRQRSSKSREESDKAVYNLMA